MQERIPAAVLVAVPYGQMVKNLFKPMGDLASSCMHASVGISGEAAELMVAGSIENVVEELGDVAFYVEAYYQQLGGRTPITLASNDPVNSVLGLGNLTTAVAVCAGELLDLTKKAWAYSAPLKEDAVRYELLRLEVMLRRACDLFGLQFEDVLGANQAKLGKRYPDGVYADEAAMRRADKQLE